MLKHLIVILSLIGSVAAAAEISREQLLIEFKADLIATCLTKRAELQKMTSDPRLITAEMCESLSDQLLSDSSPDSIQPMFDLILQRKDDKTALVKMKNDLQTMEQRFDHLKPDTVIARPALINLITKVSKK